MVNYLHPRTRMLKKIGFQKGGLPIQNRRLKFRSPEQYSKRESIGPHGSASTCREDKSINISADDVVMPDDDTEVD